jgi:hypothetical protein
MAFSTIIKPSDYFNPKLYTGNYSTNAVTGVGHAPDLVWLKTRTTAGENHYLFDVIRGVTKYLHSDTSAAQGTNAATLTTFGSDGFTVGANNSVNKSGEPLVSWNWKAGTAVSGATTGTGTAKTYTGSVNTTSGFSIVSYTGNGTAGHEIPHNLGVAPTCIILKRYDGGTTRWFVYFAFNGNTAWLELNTNDTIWNSRTEWNSTTPTSSVFSVGNQSDINADGSTYLAYCFVDIQGFSKFGSYVGNGNANGAFAYTGFKPAFIMLKNNSSIRNWEIYDSKRIGYNVANYRLPPNTAGAEETNVNIDILSNGFKARSTDGDINENAKTYSYMAFAETPFVANSGESIPTTAR